MIEFCVFLALPRCSDRFGFDLSHKLHAHMGRVTSCSPAIKRPLALEVFAGLLLTFSM